MLEMLHMTRPSCKVSHFRSEQTSLIHKHLNYKKSRITAGHQPIASLPSEKQQSYISWHTMSKNFTKFHNIFDTSMITSGLKKKICKFCNTE
jgi:hypothetical protein